MTEKQKQCLLAYLGFYTGNVDGIWGKLSKAAAETFLKGCATEDLERELLRAVAEEVPGKAFSWDTVRNFRREEFACRCGRCGGFPVEPEAALVQLCQEVRDEFGRPMILSSGVRCRAHNVSVGGVGNSRHLLGKAVDFCIVGIGAKQILQVLEKNSRVRYAYAIDESYVHMDVE